MAKKQNKKVTSKAKNKSKPKAKPIKKVAAKKPIKKTVSKKPAAKKVVKKVAAKKAVKKIVKKPAPKKVAAKKPVAKPAAKKNKIIPQKSTAKKLVAVKEVKVIKAAPQPKQLPQKVEKVAELKFKSKKTDYLKTAMKPQAVKKTPLTKRIDIPANYKPTQKEEYMSPSQLEYFRRKLDSWKKELLQESTETIQHLQAETWNEPDPSDQATIVEQTGLELRTRDRYRKLINKIDSALNRIETGDYGYCEVTGEPIGLARLEARPIATMTIAAQEQHEMEEKLSMEG